MPVYDLILSRLAVTGPLALLAMLIAGVVFLIFPATIGYPPPENPPAAIEILRSM